ncbi:MAG: hypothetical protein VX000_03260 [Myxococcota bacterium]|nr:hypothetical protein [Myxococcota bacterium]
MNAWLQDIPDGAGLDNDPGGWVDLTITNSVLSGLLLVVAALWGLYLVNRLWQGSLATDAEAGIGAARARGLLLVPPGLRARLVAAGELDGRAVQIEWRGGVRGAHSVVITADRKARVPLIDSADALDASLQRVLGG